jgi:hypothetical protein
MEFSVTAKQDISTTTLSILIQDGIETKFHTELPDERNTITGWCRSFSYLRKAQPQELNGLLEAIPPLLEIQVNEGSHPTYLNLLQALFTWTEGDEVEGQNSAENESPNLYGLHQQLKHALFNFEATISPNDEYYLTVFPYPGQGKFSVLIPRDKFDKAPVQTSQVTLTRAYEREPGCIEYFIGHYSYFQGYVLSADPTTFRVFTGLSKALVKLIRQENSSLGIYISLIPDICTFIVKNELDYEEQKEYLEPILRSFETVEQKLERLNGIIADVKNGVSPRDVSDSVNVGKLKDDGSKRLMHVISIISDYYLKLYDLDSSANFWRQARSRDPVLWFFLVLHRRPSLYLLFQIVLLSIPTFFAFHHWLTGQPCPLLLGLPNSSIGGSCHPATDSSSLVFVLVLAWYVLLLLLLFFIFTQIALNRGAYSQLLLPRILGAALVALIPLLLNDQTWDIGIESNVFNWSLLALLTYIGSFIYIFIEVHGIKKSIKSPSRAETLKESLRIFLIALSETLFIVTIASSLILPSVLSNIHITIANDRFGIYASTTLLSFGFFPALIILWTGITLFIGSFAQLLWQEQRLTASI